MDRLLADLKYATRMLRKNPGFALIALTILTLGVGASGAIFSVVDGVILKPLPYVNADRLVRIYGAWRQGSRENVSPPDFFDYREQAQGIEALAAESGFTPLLNLSGREKPVQVSGRYVSAGFFKLLGIEPVLGREFTVSEEVWEGPRVAMLSYAAWRERFDKAASAIGAQMTLSGRAYTIVGVLPPFFDIMGPAEVYLPEQEVRLEVMRKIRSQVVIGRLKPFVDIRQAQNELTVVSQRLAGSHADVDREWTAVVAPLHDEVVRNSRPAMLMLLVTAVFVVVIVSANLANLTLAKLTGRQGELATRLALGATRARVTQQVVTESLLLSLIGGAFGCGLAYGAIALVKRAGPANIPRLSTLAIEPAALLFMLAVSLVVGACLAVVPILHVRRLSAGDSARRHGGRVLGAGISRIQGVLTVVEIALTLVLLVGSGLLLRSLSQLQTVDPGFKSDHLLITRLTLPFNKYDSNEKLAAFWRKLIPSLEGIPGVVGVGATSELPLSGLNNPSPFKAVTPDQQQEFATYVRSITPGYLQTMGVSLIAGRELAATDRDGAPVAIVVNDVFKRDVFGNDEAVGRELDFPLNSFKKARVVGVVTSMRHNNLAAPPAREVYMALEQGAVLGYSVVIRTKQDPSLTVKAIQNAVWAMDPDEAMAPFRVMDDVIQGGLGQERFRAAVLALFAVVAIILSAVGLYGVLSYLVSQRAREIGMRMALGATQQDILRLILGRGLTLTMIGIATGGCLALVLVGALKTLLFGIGSLDPVTLSSVPVLLIVIGAVSSCVPALRAARLSPVQALRNE